MRVVITTHHLNFRSVYLQNAASVNAFNVVRQEKIVLSFSGNVYTGTVNRLDLEPGSVKERHLALGAVTTAVLAEESVTESKIRDSNVTLQKLEPSLRNVFREIRPNTNVIVATKDVNEDYHVAKRIYAKDFMLENADGSLGSLQGSIVDDAKTTGSTTWSSVFILARLKQKSDIGHTHENYSLASHHHNELYSLRSHNHDGIYSPTWHNHDTLYYTQYQTDAKLAQLKDEVIVASKDEWKDYHVDRKIYAKDFLVENADGSLSNLQSMVIDDTKTTGRTTWSSVFINAMLTTKSDAGHIHNGYSLAAHTHENYSLASHHHDELYSVKSHHHDMLYYTQYQTDTKLTQLKNQMIVASKDEKEDYHVSQKIYAKDFVVENADGSLSNLQSKIIDDTQTTGQTTWSSVFINSRLNTKSDTGHTHNNYSLAAHTHQMAQISDFPVLSDWVKQPAKPVYQWAEIQNRPTSLPASDVSAWAKQSAKPIYQWAEIQNRPTSLPASDVSAWAKQSAKPTYQWAEIQDKPTSMPANGGVSNSVNSIPTVTYGAVGLQYCHTQTPGDGTNGSNITLPFDGWWYNLIMNHSNADGYYTQLASYFFGDELKFRRMTKGVLSDWRTLYHSGNSNNSTANWEANRLKSSTILVVPRETPNGNEGIRIAKASNGKSVVAFATDSSQAGYVSGQWEVGVQPSGVFSITKPGVGHALQFDGGLKALVRDVIATG